MTDEPKTETTSAATNVLPLRTGVMNVMEILFELEETVRNSEVTIEEIAECAQIAIEDGYDLMLIALSMCSMAIEDAKKMKSRLP